MSGAWLYRLAHASIAAVSACFSWLSSVWGLLTAVRSAVLEASRASCLVLWKPINCDLLGSHCSVMLVVGYLSSSVLNLSSSLMDSAWSPCGDVSRALLMVISEAAAMVIGLCC